MMNRTDAFYSLNWKDKNLAFPDTNCECLNEDYIPVLCSKCGANRTKNNWISNQSLTQEE